MVTERSSRLLALALLSGVLVVLLMATGTLTPVSELHHYPDADDLSQDYAAHQGERVEVAGTVVRTDPVVIGSAVAVLIGTVLVPRRHRTRVLALLALGAASHLLLDALLVNPSGHLYAVF